MKESSETTSSKREKESKSKNAITMNPFEEETTEEKYSTNPFDDSISSFPEDAEVDENLLEKEEENAKNVVVEGSISPKKKKKKKGFFKKRSKDDNAEEEEEEMKKKEEVLPTLSSTNSNPFDSDDDDDYDKEDDVVKPSSERSSNNPFDDDDDNDNDDEKYDGAMYNITTARSSDTYSTASSTNSQPNDGSSERRRKSSNKKKKKGFLNRFTRDSLSEDQVADNHDSDRDIESTPEREKDKEEENGELQEEAEQEEEEAEQRKKEKTNTFFRRSRSKSPSREILQEVAAQQDDNDAEASAAPRGNTFMNKMRRSRSKSPSQDLLQNVNDAAADHNNEDDDNDNDDNAPPPQDAGEQQQQQQQENRGRKKRNSLISKVIRRRSKSPSSELNHNDDEEDNDEEDEKEFMQRVRNLDLEEDKDGAANEIKTFHDSVDLKKDLIMDFSGWGTKRSTDDNDDDDDDDYHEEDNEENDYQEEENEENKTPAQENIPKEETSTERRGFFGRIQRKKSKDAETITPLADTTTTTTPPNDNTNPFDYANEQQEEQEIGGVYRIKPDQCVQFIHQKQQHRLSSGSKKSESSTTSSSSQRGEDSSPRQNASGSGSGGAGGGLFTWFGNANNNATEETSTSKEQVTPTTKLTPENEALCKSMKEEDIDEDLAILDSMDIDSDFNAWTSFRSMSTSPAKGVKASNNETILEEGDEEGEVTEAPPPPPPPKLSRDDILELRKWSSRVEREEIYAFKYRPVPRETKEISSLAKFLGLSRSKHGGGGERSSGSEKGGVAGKLGGLISGSGSGSERSKSNSSRSTTIPKKRPILSTLFYPADYEPKSILLKRGPVLRNNQERELILLTHGFVIATVASPSSSAPSVPSPTNNNGVDANSNPSSPDWAAGAGAGAAGVDENNDVVPPPPPPTSSPSPATKKKGGLNKLFSNMPAAIAKKVIRRNYESCTALSNVVDVSDLALIPLDNNSHIMNEASTNDNEENEIHHNLSNENAFSVTTMEEEGHRLITTTHVFVCAFPEHKQAWLHALEISVIRAHMYNHLSESNYEIGGVTDSRQLAKKRKIGWQHEIIRTSLHSAAYYDDLEMLRHAIALATKPENNSTTLSPITSATKSQGGIDALDDYDDSLSALHYASMKNHLECMKELLKAGADPNVLGGNGKPPLWYADQNKHTQAVKLLVKNGADKKCLRKDDNNNDRGTLFGNIGWQRQAPAPAPAPQQPENKNTVETYTFRHNRKKDDVTAATKDADNKAKNVSNVMSENMDALRERGERIENLDEKTRELQNEAKNYRDLARQLKEKQKKQATFLGFKL